ncbi:MAG TPA: acyl-CoA dehydrogenase family protein [Gaiellaceae bacterium]|nr:acyl-CoA dehydrogenase family protein [Gaiellaceae bacterium]
MIELQPRTIPGRRLVELAEAVGPDLANRAPRHDREGSYPFASIARLQGAGYFAAPVPEAYGGLGADSVHDLVIASSRLARADASVAIGVNMHLVALLNVVRRRQTAAAAGNERRAAAFEATMRQIVADGVIMAAAISEPGQDITKPATVAARTDTGWRLDGRKIFCTMSPAATVLYTAVSFLDDDGEERYGYAMVPAGTPGLTIHDDWDGLGMRASGSHSVTFAGVELPSSALRGGFPVGSVGPYIERNLTAGLFHASASLGIAEAAHAIAVETIARRNGHADGHSRMLVAGSAIELSAIRGTLARAAALVDDHYGSHATDDGTDDELAGLFAEAQAAKTFINEASTRIVDRALALSGGAGYVNSSPLARAYRDVRAGAFMHPLGANRAYDFVAGRALGHVPVLR